jgi:hypothetical protein
MKRLLATLALASLAASFLPGVALGDTPAPTADADASKAPPPAAATPSSGDVDVDRIAAAGHTIRSNWTPPGKDQRYGHAEVLVHAPIAAVRKVVLDYAHYKDLSGDRIKATRIVAKDAGNTDVYTRIPIMNGLLTVWYVVRYAPLKVVSPGTEMVEGQMVKGNIRAMNGVWNMRSVNDEWTVLKLDLLMLPDVNIPQAWIDESLRDAAADAVNAIHDRAQGDPTWVPWHGGATSVSASASK